jgi:hypothetical protein
MNCGVKRDCTEGQFGDYSIHEQSQDGASTQMVCTCEMCIIVCILHYVETNQFITAELIDRVS